MSDLLNLHTTAYYLLSCDSECYSLLLRMVISWDRPYKPVWGDPVEIIPEYLVNQYLQFVIK